MLNSGAWKPSLLCWGCEWQKENSQPKKTACSCQNEPLPVHKSDTLRVGTVQVGLPERARKNPKDQLQISMHPCVCLESFGAHLEPRGNGIKAHFCSRDMQLTSPQREHTHLTKPRHNSGGLRGPKDMAGPNSTKHNLIFSKSEHFELCISIIMDPCLGPSVYVSCSRWLLQRMAPALNWSVTVTRKIPFLA